MALDDLDLAAERAVVRGSKPGHDRVVFLTPTLIAALHHYLEKRPELPDEGRVFVLHGRSPTPRTIQRRLRKYGKEAGVDVSPHKLRHTMGRPFGRLVNASKDATRDQKRVSSPWRLSGPSPAESVSFQGT